MPNKLHLPTVIPFNAFACLLHQLDINPGIVSTIDHGGGLQVITPIPMEGSEKAPIEIVSTFSYTHLWKYDCQFRVAHDFDFRDYPYNYLIHCGVVSGKVNNAGTMLASACNRNIGLAMLHHKSTNRNYYFYRWTDLSLQFSKIYGDSHGFDIFKWVSNPPEDGVPVDILSDTATLTLYSAKD